jgi:hypothetical protein
MSLYSQQVSNNPLTLDGLLTGNFDLLYVDGQPIVPTDTSGLVPYVGATTAVNLNNKKITTTYMAVNAEDLTNKDFTDGTYLAKAGFLVNSGTFHFDMPATVRISNADFFISCPVSSIVAVLALDSTGKVVQVTATGIGNAFLGATQTFFGYNTFSLFLTTTGIINTGDISTTGLLTCNNLDITGLTTATPVLALGINASNQVVKFAGGTGDAILAGGTIPFPQQFTGYNAFINPLRISTLTFSTPVSAGTPSYILGVDVTGNLISTTPTTAPSTLTITNTAVTNTYYPTWITSTTTGVKTIFGVNGVSYDLPSGILTTTQLKIGTVPTGTQLYLLAVDSAGNVIRGTSTGGGDAYLANTQTFTGVNTFSNDMILSKSFSLTLGSVNMFQVRNSSLVTQFTVTNTGVTMGNLVLTGTIFNMSSTSPNFIYSGDSLAISASTNTTKTIIMSVAGTGLTLDQYGASLSSDTKTLYCNNYEGLSFLGINMVGYQDSFFKIGNTVNISSQPVGWDFQTKFNTFPNYGTNVRISGLGVGTNALYSFGSNDLNITCSSTINYGTNTAHSFSINSVGAFALSVDGLWMPSSSSRSFYITDNYPKNATSTYGRYFGLSGTIYQDFYQNFIWRRDSALTGTSVQQLMSLDANGLTLSNAVNIGNPQLTFAGSGSPSIKCTGGGYNWFIGGTQCGYFDTITASGHWRISTNSAQKLILCSGGQNTLQLGNGGLGNYPAEIYGYRTVTGSYWQYTAGGATWGGVFTSFNVGLYVQYTISADGGYLLASDERIKTDIKPAEIGSLEVIKTIPIKSHAYIDSFINGCPTAYNVIAQDIQKFYPEAITITDGFIPDMYVKCRWIHVDDKQIEINIPKPHTVIVGDKVKLILEDSTHKEAIVTAIKDQNTFAVEKWDEFKMEISDELFVYGKNVKDFLRVDKIKLGVLALAGVKELNKIVEAQQEQISKQQQTIETLTGHLAKLTEQVNLLTKILSPV